jgi:hypothetical protein
MSVLIVLGEDGAESPVDHTEDHAVGHNLSETRGSSGERQEHARGEEDEENNRDEDVCIERGHLLIGT